MSVEMISYERGNENPAYYKDGSTEDVAAEGKNVMELRQRKGEVTPDDVTPCNGDVEGQNGGHVKGKDEDPEDQEDEVQLHACGRWVENFRLNIITFYKDHKVTIIRLFWLLLFILYLCYFGYAMYYEFGSEASIRLLVLTCFIVFLILNHLLSPWIDPFFDKFGDILDDPRHAPKLRVVKWVLYIALLVLVVVVLVVLVGMVDSRNLVSLGGLAAFLLFCYVFSHSPSRVNWHPVIWGLGLQFIFALLILKTRPGYDAFSWLGDRITEFLGHTDAGSQFVFGTTTYTMHFFAFKVLPVIIFFSSFISVLYYLGAMQAVISVIGRFLSFCLDTTPAESINAAGNIFVGMTEAPLMIRPFIERMTNSEIHAVMTGGFATIAGSVLGAYIGFGVPANHLLSASVMSAPAALAISKLMYPETEKPQIQKDDYKKLGKQNERNVIEAAFNGASAAVPLVANVAANVLAFLALLAFVNATLEWFGNRVGLPGFNFDFICSYVLYPVALFMGASLSDCRQLARLVGIKTFTNEFIAYEALKVYLDNKKAFTNYTTTFGNQSIWHTSGDDMVLDLWNNATLKGGIMELRSEVIATYALCGFSNFGSMGILLGGLVTLAPSRKTDMTGMVFRAMIAGNIACFTTACIAGLFFDSSIEGVLK